MCGVSDRVLNKREREIKRGRGRVKRTKGQPAVGKRKTGQQRKEWRRKREVKEGEKRERERERERSHGWEIRSDASAHERAREVCGSVERRGKKAEVLVEAEACSS